MHLHSYLKQMSFKPPLLTFSSTIASASSLEESFPSCKAPACVHTPPQRKGAESTSAGQTAPWGAGKAVSSSDRNTGREMVCQSVFNRAAGTYAGYLASLCCFMLASGSVLGMETWEGLCVVRS